MELNANGLWSLLILQVDAKAGVAGDFSIYTARVPLLSVGSAGLLRVLHSGRVVKDVERGVIFGGLVTVSAFLCSLTRLLYVQEATAGGEKPPPNLVLMMIIILPMVHRVLDSRLEQQLQD